MWVIYPSFQIHIYETPGHSCTWFGLQEVVIQNGGCKQSLYFCTTCVVSSSAASGTSKTASERQYWIREIYVKMEFVFKLLSQIWSIVPWNFERRWKVSHPSLRVSPTEIKWQQPKNNNNNNNQHQHIQGLTTNPISNVLTAHAHNIPRSNVTDLTEKENLKQKNGSEDKTRSWKNSQPLVLSFNP